MDHSRLLQQMQFLTEADKLKSVVRLNRTLHGHRRENSAEHSWHLALMALVLSEHASHEVDVLRVVGMLIVHDLVEIDAGDTFAFDESTVLTQREREERAAERIFGLLPSDMAEKMRAVWEDFEARVTPEAQFARSLDNLGGGVLPNCHHEGGCWREAGVTVECVKALNGEIAAGSPVLWEYAEGLIDDAHLGGFIRSADDPLESSTPAPEPVFQPDRHPAADATKDLTLSIEDAPTAEDTETLQATLQTHNRQYVGPSGYKGLTIFLRDERGQVVGGLIGSTHRGWLKVETLAVDAAFRGQGHGMRLMQAAEHEALARGCRRSWAGTYSFQARPFYERQGYRVFATLENYPEGYRGFFLFKELPEPKEVRG